MHINQSSRKTKVCYFYMKPTNFARGIDPIVLISRYIKIKKGINRQVDRQIDKIDRQIHIDKIDRQIGRYIDRQIGRYIDRQINSQTWNALLR